LFSRQFVYSRKGDWQHANLLFCCMFNSILKILCSIILTFTLSMMLESMGFFIAKWGTFFGVYQRTKATILHNRSCSCNHFAGELGNFFSSLLTFSGTILTHAFSSGLWLKSVSQFLSSCSVHLQFSTVNCLFFYLIIHFPHI